MCSLGDDDDNFNETTALKLMSIKEKPSLSEKCNKCRENTPCILLRSKDKYCKICFLQGATHKFKSTLGKLKLIRPNDRVLIVYKGGHPTTSLLHFLRTGLELNTHKKLRFEPIVFYLENNVELPLDDRYELLKNVENEVRRFNFPLNFAKITQIIENNNEITKDPKRLQLNANDRQQLDLFVEKQRNLTRKLDYLQITVRNFYVEIARKLQCRFVFLPDTSLDVAAQLLSDISLGRGSQVPLDAGICDSRDDIKILRPLRQFDMKELVFYNNFNNLETVILKKIDKNPYSSVQNLMKKFVGDLQNNYPATITTILKTGDKLAIDSSDNLCNLCRAPIFENDSQLTSAESTRFSHWLSTQTIDDTLTPQMRFSTSFENFNNSTTLNYCFSCNNLLID